MFWVILTIQNLTISNYVYKIQSQNFSKLIRLLNDSLILEKLHLILENSGFRVQVGDNLIIPYHFDLYF